MELEYFLFCHASAWDAQERMSILCIFTVVHRPKAPLALVGEAVASVSFSPEEQGEVHTGRAQFLNADGFMQAESEEVSFSIPTTADNAPFRQHFRFDLTGLVVPEFGDYDVHLLIYNTVIKTTSLRALRTRK